MQNISITGDLGSGKSAVSKLLVQQGYSYISMGTLFREEAARRGVTVEQLNKLAETDSSIDSYVDNLQKTKGMQVSNTIFDSRLAFHFVPNSYKVYLTVNLNESINRIYQDTTRIAESNSTLEETRQSTIKRRALEVQRYKQKYHVDYTDFNNYNLVLDTTNASPNTIANMIQQGVQNQQTACLLSIRNIKPTQSMRDINKNTVNYYTNNAFKPISVTVDKYNDFYVTDGHHRLLASMMLGWLFIPTTISRGETPYSTKSWCYDFEDIGRFKYKSYPAKLN